MTREVLTNILNNAILFSMEKSLPTPQETTETETKPKSRQELAAEYGLPAYTPWSEIDAHTAAKVRKGGTALQ